MPILLVLSGAAFLPAAHGTYNAAFFTGVGIVTLGIILGCLTAPRKDV